jgi:aspartyl-tRNA(Asn)/glutamyl-tRNA(Gln) amidotransferase subunit A
MTRSAKDSAILLEAIAGPCSQDSTCADLAVPRYCETLSLGIQGKVIGLPKEYFGPGTHPEVSAALDQAIQAFEKLGATVKEVSLPHTDAAVAAYYIIAPAEASSNLARFDGVRYGFRAEGENLKDMYENTRSQGFGAEVKRRILIGTYVLSSGHFDAYYVQAQKVRNLILQDFVQAFEQEACDLLLGPVSPTPPFALGEKTSDPLSMYLNDIFTIPVNLAGLPAASIPGGFTQDGLPIGLHLIAPRFQEEKLFQFAQAFQEQSDWHTRSPF